MCGRGSHDRDAVQRPARGPLRGDVPDGLTSQYAGEPWSDHPGCVHPVLAAVARGVNDRTSDEGRDHLASMVPWLAGTAGAGPQASPRLVLECAAAALEGGTLMRYELEAARRLAAYVAARRAAGPGTGAPALRKPAPHIRVAVAVLGRAGLLERVYERAAVLQVSQAVALVADAAGGGAGRDLRLRRLLAACARVCYGGSMPCTPPSPTCPVHLAPSQ